MMAASDQRCGSFALKTREFSLLVVSFMSSKKKIISRKYQYFHKLDANSIRLLQLRGVPVEHLAAEKKFINLTPIQK